MTFDALYQAAEIRASVDSLRAGVAEVERVALRKRCAAAYEPLLAEFGNWTRGILLSEGIPLEHGWWRIPKKSFFGLAGRHDVGAQDGTLIQKSSSYFMVVSLDGRAGPAGFSEGTRPELWQLVNTVSEYGSDKLMRHQEYSANAEFVIDERTMIPTIVADGLHGGPHRLVPFEEFAAEAVRGVVSSWREAQARASS